MTSPYLERPLRTLEQARAEIAARRDMGARAMPVNLEQALEREKSIARSTLAGWVRELSQ